MKSILYSFILLCSGAFYSYSQDIGRMSASFENEPLKEVITELTVSFGLRFAYDERLIENKTVSTSFENVGIEEALDAVFFELGIQYEVERDRYVILSSTSFYRE